MEIEDTEIDKDLIKHWRSLKKKPTVIVFDLDYTLWPYYVDHVEPPIRKISQKEVTDSVGFRMNAFKDVDSILKTLKQHCMIDRDQHLAVASRSTTPILAMEAIEALGWKDYFSSIQIYPKSKTIHMNRIKDELNLDNFKHVLFFDDEHLNIRETSKLGVCAVGIECEIGLDMKTLLHGLNLFNSK